MPTSSQHTYSTYILRRACWLGRCCRTDVINAFDVSASRASMALKHAVDMWPETLATAPRMGVVRISSAQIPQAASANEMLRLMESGSTMQVLGGSSEEFGLVLSPPLTPSRPAEGLDTILEVVIQNRAQNWQALEILYCGLKLGAESQWRLVVPNGMECHNGQWRLLAIDIGASTSGDLRQRTFIFPRIARVKPGRWPRGIRKKDLFWASQGLVHRKIVFNPSLTNDQKAALSREFGVHKGRIELYGRAEFEFRRIYTNDNKLVANDIAWPLIKEIG